MGDRANVIITAGENPPVVLYSHWGGTDLHNGSLEAAMINARHRIGDPGYYVKLLADSLEEQGLLSGIGTTLDDNEHPIMVVDSFTGKRQPDLTEQQGRDYLAVKTRDTNTDV